MRIWKCSVVGLCLAMLGCVLFPGQTPARAESEVKALFINVGKADAALLFLGDQRILVDTGHKDSYDALESALASYGVDHLDGVFITHTDKDHVGGLNKLLAVFAEENINIEYMYAILSSSEHAYMIFRVADTVRAEAAMRGRGFKGISQDEMSLI